MIHLKSLLTEGIKTYINSPRHSLSIDEDKLKSIGENLYKVLKKKYSYLSDLSEPSFYYKINSSTGKVDFAEFALKVFTRGDYGMTTIYGVEWSQHWLTDTVEIKHYNIVAEIPSSFDSRDPDDISFNELKNLINDLNKEIEPKVIAFTNKNKLYDKAFSYMKKIEGMQNEISSELTTKISNSFFMKKTEKKIQSFYGVEPISFEFLYTSFSYNEASINLYATCSEFFDLDFKRFSTKKLIGSLKYNSAKDKFSFEPNFSNSQYFSNKVTSLRYMRKNFLTHFEKALNAE